MIRLPRMCSASGTLRAASLLLFLLLTGWRLSAAPDLSSLTEGARIEGFSAVSLYVNDDGRPFGARFRHEATGFILDYLIMETAPEYFIWVNSYPTSDMGEPHTQEHLLLGKGNVGRETSSLKNMLLIESSAYTMQWRTCYHAQTAAGPEAFFAALRAELNALLHPDYTDEEIRREVCHVGVTESPDGTLGLEEKGTVYNEMASTFERPWSRMSRALDIALNGAHHPLAFVSGGLPDAIRRMKPEDIRRFHADNYRLENMGMIVALPSSMALEPTLKRLGDVLSRLPPTPGRGNSSDSRPVIARVPAASTTPITADYPSVTDNTPSPVLMAWNTVDDLSLEDEIAITLFLKAFAGDPSTNLYRRLVDAQSRTIQCGATDVFGWISSDQGHPLYIGLSNVDPSWMTEGQMERLRNEVMDELTKIAAMRDDAKELADLNQRVRSRIVEARRDAKKFLGTPPGFGMRHTSSAWMETLRLLERTQGFRKYPTMGPLYRSILQRMNDTANIWRGLLSRIGVSEQSPYIAAARPSPSTLQQDKAERRQRIESEASRLQTRYGIDSEQEAIRQYRNEYDEATRVLDSIAALVAMPRFVQSPPMTLDDDIHYSRAELSNGIPCVTSTFEDMAGATVGMALRLDDVLPKHCRYLSALPALLSQSGLFIDGRAIPYADMREQMRLEIQGLSIYYSINPDTRRYELVARGQGLVPDENRRAIEWMSRILNNVDWRRENLPRLQVIVDQSLKGLRNTMQGSEENWANNPANAWRWESDRLYLATSSFLTQEHNYFRLRWLLKDIDGVDDTAALGKAFEKLAASADGSRRGAVEVLLKLLSGQTGIDHAPRRMEEIVAAVNELSDRSRAIIQEAARDVLLRLNDIPDDALGIDVRELFLTMRNDLMTDPADVLADLDMVRKSLLKSARARFFAIGSTASLQQLNGSLASLAMGLSSTPPIATARPTSPMIAERIARRRGGKPAPIFVGLVNPSTSSGVIVNSATQPDYRARDTAALVDILAGMMYGGSGAHSIFMKTWSAGLAYSNGIQSWIRPGRIIYYAERCPALPQTLEFVVEQLKKATFDSSLVEYAIAQTFADSRAGDTYEQRGEAAAADEADGISRDVVRAFRQRLLALRSMPGLAEKIRQRLPIVCSRVLPGWGARKETVDRGVYFVIGPDSQLDLYDAYLNKAEGGGAGLVRIYPRDFWME